MEILKALPASGYSSALSSLNWLQKMRPALTLVYLSLMGCICMIGVEKYLKLKIDPRNSLSFMAIIFGIYTINRFTDKAEDFTNDLTKLLFFEKQRIFFFLAAASLVGTIGFLTVIGKFNWVYLVLLSVGFAYSFRCIPWYSKSLGFFRVRIKEILLLKNLSVAFLWGAAIFLIPILSSPHAEINAFLVWMLAFGMFLSTFNNTLFDDIMDVDGDKAAGIKTVPTYWGVKASRIILWSIDIIWVFTVLVLFLLGKLNTGHFVFLSILGIYPVFYLSFNLGSKFSKNLISFCAESDLCVFGIGLILLSSY